MRIFWVLMLVLTIGAAGVLASRYGKEPSSTAVVEQTSSRGPQAMAVEPRPTEPMPVQPAPAGDAVIATAETPPEAVLLPEAFDPTVDVVEESGETSVAQASAEESPAVPAPERVEVQTLDSLLGLSEPHVAEDVTVAREVGTDEPAEEAAAGAIGVNITGEELAEGIILNDEKNLVVAARFVVPGAGTAEAPYVVSWDLLIAVQEHYRPRQGMTEIPAWIKFFEGKHVRLAGFVMPPMMGDDMREVLLMQNEWDGCCVGVPPTPYDAVEVKLTKNPRGLSQYTMNYGEITGVFKVDPFVQGEWLLGLYLMDGADLVIKGL